jgi:lysophospholipase L1-like esterase
LDVAPGRVTERPPVTSRAVPVSTVGPGATAVFLGDSYTSGWNGAGLGSRGWPALVAAARGWSVVNLAVPGTGFMNPGWTDQPIGSRVDTAVRHRPDIVFIVGGHNDSRWSPATTMRAADRVVARLRVALPRAVIVVIGPIWQNGSPPARCLILRAGLRTEARTIGRTIFIDPLAEGWFAGASHRYIGGDGLHPTDAGHRFLAQRILADLRGA